MDEFESVCFNMLSNLSTFIDKYNMRLCNDEYRYNILRGNISGIATIDNVDYTVAFSYNDIKQTFYDLYHYRFNLGLYNKVNNINNDLLVYIVQTQTTYMFKYDVTDYTIRHGAISHAIKSTNYRPGVECLSCSIKDCRARLITNLERI